MNFKEIILIKDELKLKTYEYQKLNDENLDYKIKQILKGIRESQSRSTTEGAAERGERGNNKHGDEKRKSGRGGFHRDPPNKDVYESRKDYDERRVSDEWLEGGFRPEGS